ncbi:hypothetical protein MA16_Dca018504 [Dendrobium catenatum]|uniref:Uncharacterized protein n=1 Tax=Dendrobium catenatum TaxID=906689 RepID=A0A2I0VAE7_9ASPA|nr:hypothetical protein MA16_Dca018504 [Dendrobium catenatum]
MTDIKAFATVLMYIEMHMKECNNSQSTYIGKTENECNNFLQSSTTQYQVHRSYASRGG